MSLVRDEIRACQTPTEILRLLGTNDLDRRIVVAAHAPAPTLTHEVIERMVRRGVADALALNPNATPDILATTATIVTIVLRNELARLMNDDVEPRPAERTSMLRLVKALIALNNRGIPPSPALGEPLKTVLLWTGDWAIIPVLVATGRELTNTSLASAWRAAMRGRADTGDIDTPLEHLAPLWMHPAASPELLDDMFQGIDLMLMDSDVLPAPGEAIAVRSLIDRLVQQQSKLLDDDRHRFSIVAYHPSAATLAQIAARATSAEILAWVDDFLEWHAIARRAEHEHPDAAFWRALLTVALPHLDPEQLTRLMGNPHAGIRTDVFMITTAAPTLTSAASPVSSPSSSPRASSPSHPSSPEGAPRPDRSR